MLFLFLLTSLFYLVICKAWKYLNYLLNIIYVYSVCLIAECSRVIKLSAFARLYQDLLLTLSIFSSFEITLFLLNAKYKESLYIAFMDYQNRGFEDFHISVVYFILLFLSYFAYILSDLFSNSETNSFLKNFWNYDKNLKVWKILMLFLIPIFVSVILGVSLLPDKAVVK